MAFATLKRGFSQLGRDGTSQRNGILTTVMTKFWSYLFLAL